jgi:hypothetical protein
MRSSINPYPADLTSGCDLQKEVGDIVSLGPNVGTEYEVLAIHGQDAWVKTTNPNGYGGGFIVALGRLRWIRASVKEEIAA